MVSNDRGASKKKRHPEGIRGRQNYIILNKIVIRYADGKIRKGSGEDFFPNRNFHMHDIEDGGYHEVNVSDLKAVFFVKTLERDPNYRERFDIERVGLGKKSNSAFPPTRVFHMIPADPDCNNERVFAVIAATKDIYLFLGECKLRVEIRICSPPMVSVANGHPEDYQQFATRNKGWYIYRWFCLPDHELKL